MFTNAKFTNAKIQEKLQKLKLPVGRRKEVLLDCYQRYFDGPTAPAHLTGTDDWIPSWG